MAENNQARRRLFGREARQVGSFAMIQPSRAKVTSAALKKIADGGMKQQPLASRWAADAYDYADQIGEVGFVMNLSANMGAQCNLQAQEWDLEAKEWIITEDERCLRVLAAFQGPQGGQSELKRRAFLHLAIAGESFLVGSPTNENGVDTGILWEFLSSQELVVKRGERPERRRAGGAGEPLGDDHYIARMWRSHPQYSDLADSAMRRVLGICGEILTLTQMVDAVAKSRLNAGLLYVPDEITFAVPDDESGELPENDGIDSFIQELMEHLSAPVKDRTSAASLVPLVVRGPAALKDSVGLIDVARNLDTWAQELRKEALGRLGAGLDIDPAIVEGKASLNHWTAYNVDADFITKHVRPQGELFADFVTFAYLRPMLEEFEGLSEDESRRFRISFDPSPIVARTDEASSARVLHDMEVISNGSLLRANGFDSTDEPDEEEIKLRRAWRLLQSNPAALGPVLGELCGLGDVDWSKAGGSGGQGGEAGGGPGDLTPPDATSGQAEPPQPNFAALVDRVAVAADAAVERAMERAGAKLVTKARRDITMRDRVAAVDKGRALALVRPSELEAMGLTAADLLDGAWDSLSLKVRGWLRPYLELRGRSPLVADDQAALAASELCRRLDEYVVEHLHRTLPVGPTGLRVPDHIVMEALAGAGVA